MDNLEELSMLRVAANEKYAEACEWRDIAEELAERARDHECYGDCPMCPALARYDRATLPVYATDRPEDGA